VPSSGIVESYGSSSFSFLKNLHTDFHSDMPDLNMGSELQEEDRRPLSWSKWWDSWDFGMEFCSSGHFLVPAHAYLC
jgi:hypothetical protein